MGDASGEDNIHICTTNTTPQVYQNSMCPAGRALAHPVAGLLKEWATLGCPTCTGKPWTRGEMWGAVTRGPHQSALSPKALVHFAEEAAEKVRNKQARIVLWDDIKDNPPRQLNILPITAISNKFKAFHSILDLSFQLRLKNWGILASVNDTTEKLTPKEAIDQIGDCLSRIILCICGGGPKRQSFHGKIGHQRWTLVHGLRRG